MLLLLYISVAVAASSASVVALDSKEALDAFVGSESATIIKFYAPWCGHCKRMAADFVEAAERLQGTARLGEVDCTQYKSVCSAFGVHGYPTLKVFTKGDSVAYTGKRTADDFVTTVRAAAAIGGNEKKSEL